MPEKNNKIRNIALVVYSHYSRDARVRRYADALSGLNYSVDVICLKENYRSNNPNIKLIRYPFERKRLPGAYRYIFEYLFFFLYSLILLSLKNLNNKYSLIHVNNMPDFLVFSTVIPKLTGTKVILDMHDPMPELFMSKFRVNKNHQIVKFLILMEKISFIYSDFLLTANPEFKKIFKSRQTIDLNNKMEIILNCPDYKLIHKKSIQKKKNSHFNLTYMGTIDERFELHIPIQSLPFLVKEIPDIRLNIIPKIIHEGKYFLQLKKMIGLLKLGKFVRIYPPQSLENLVDLISFTDIGIVLAESGIFSQSIMPVKLLEFIQLEIPVIATRTRSLEKNFTPEAINFIEYNNIYSFSQAVLKLYGNELLRNNFVSKAKSYLTIHNWKKEKIKYEKIITGLTG